MKSLEEVKASKKDVLLPADIAPILRCNPYSINLAARDYPERLGFPVMCIGTRVKIPRLAFIKFMEEGISNE